MLFESFIQFINVGGHAGSASPWTPSHFLNIFLNSLSNGKFLDWLKLKEFADEKVNVAGNLNFVLGRVENIVGKGEHTGCQHFSFSYSV